MKTISLIIFSSLFFYKLTSGQNIFWSENFNQTHSLCFPNSSPFQWVVTAIGTQGSNSNDWYIFYPVENQYHSCFSLNSNLAQGALYIGYGINSCDSAINGPVYKKGCDNATKKIVESPVIDCTNKSDIILDFDLLARNYFVYDYASCLVSTNGGSSWDTIKAHLNSGYCYSALRNGFWNHQTFILPAAANNNSNVKIGFIWVNNDDCLGSEMSVAIDNITLSTCNIVAGIHFSPDLLCSDILIPFRDNSARDSSYDYTWVFDGIDMQTDYNTTYSFDSPGSHTVTLIVSSGSMCADTITDTLTIYQSYQVNISTSDDTICPGDCIDFTTTMTPSTYPGGNYLYSWSFNSSSPSYSSLANPQNICFQTPGDIVNHLTVSNTVYSGCNTSKDIHIIVETCGYPTVSTIEFKPNVICVGGCSRFESNAQNATSFSWSFPYGTPSTSSDINPTVCYDSVGTYSVNLTVSNSVGSISINGLVEVHDYPPIPIITRTGWDPVLMQEIFTLTNSYNTSIYQFKWFKHTYSGWVQVGTTNSITYTATQDGDYKVKVWELQNVYCPNELIFSIVLP